MDIDTFDRAQVGYRRDGEKCSELVTNFDRERCSESSGCAATILVLGKFVADTDRIVPRIEYPFRVKSSVRVARVFHLSSKMYETERIALPFAFRLRVY